MKRAIYDGVLLLDESLPYEVVELPLPRDSPVELLEPESGPPKEPHGRNAAEKREILDRLYAYRKSAGLGCFEPLAEACGKGITPDLLRRLYSGDEVVPIQVWRQVGAGLGKLGVSKLDTKWGISMGDCVRIEEYRRTCANCYWHNDAMGACRHPGGWWWDKRYHHCATFRWPGRPTGEKERRNSA